MRALVVEDDPDIARGLCEALTQAGHAVDACSTLSQAWAALQAESFEVVLLDLGLPDGDGTKLLERLRQLEPAPLAHTPVIIMTARDSIGDRIAGLDRGADDYLSKPFDVNELLARLRAIQRRAAGRARATLVHGPLELDPAAHTVTLSGQPVHLSGREFSLLHTLLLASPRVLSKAQLCASIYAFDEGLESNAIEVHIYHLRRKLGDGLIRTMRGVGYFIPRAQP
jgi:DNA-binding response OmpR family regulator